MSGGRRRRQRHPAIFRPTRVSHRARGNEEPRLRGLATATAVLTLAVAAPAAPAGQASEAPTSIGRGGAAATVDRLASQAAIDTLRRGGNATDATVTAAAVLGVTEPFSAGIGGDGFMVSYDARSREARTSDHRETAPRKMRPESFFVTPTTALTFNDARYSGLSVGVPGTVRGWARELRRQGTISLADALTRRSASRGAGSSSTPPSRRRRRRTSTTSTTSRPRRSCTSTPMERRAASARSSATLTSPARTS